MRVQPIAQPAYGSDRHALTVSFGEPLLGPNPHHPLLPLLTPQLLLERLAAHRSLS